jgi:hypothetical protein
MFDANGWFSFQLAQPGRPKFASDNRLQGTAEENKATVQGSLSYYGKFSVDETDRVLHLYIESSSWPNFDGIDNKRIVTSLSDNELKWHSPAGSMVQRPKSFGRESNKRRSVANAKRRQGRGGRVSRNWPTLVANAGRDASFTPSSGHHGGNLARPIRSTFGLMHCSKAVSARYTASGVGSCRDSGRTG